MRRHCHPNMRYSRIRKELLDMDRAEGLVVEDEEEEQEERTLTEDKDLRARLANLQANCAPCS